jgi:membrane fusion protein (multidrug efflux system)
MHLNRHTAILATVLCLASPLAAQQAQQAPAIPVGVIVTAEEDVTPAQTFVGRVEAVSRVSLVARVTGFLEQQAFRDGQDVEKDALLFVIERQPFVASVNSAKATLASAEAQKLNADVQLQRAEELVRTNNIPVATRDQRRAEAEAAAANVLEARAALEQAEINLGYTLIRAPVAGRIGRANISVGNVVSPDVGALALLVSQDPMFVTFPVSQRVLLDIKRERMEKGTENPAVNVRVAFSDGTLYSETGQLDFVDVTVGQATDTITVRAQIANPQRLLTDGQLVTVRVEGREPDRRVVIPQSAVLLDQQGAYVFVAENNRAAVRRIKTGQPIGGRITVQEGLRPGESLIVDGIQRIRPGAAVQGTPLPAVPGRSSSAPSPTSASGRAG